MRYNDDYYSNVLVVVFFYLFFVAIGFSAFSFDRSTPRRVAVKPDAKICAKCEDDPDSYQACYEAPGGCVKNVCNTECCRDGVDRCCCLHEGHRCTCEDDPKGPPTLTPEKP